MPPLTRDVFFLMEALPVLADIARYGDTGKQMWNQSGR